MDENRGKVGGRGGEALDANDASDDWASRADRPAHACQVCPANVCKGDILDELLIGPDEEGPGRFDAVVYVGDGSNDVCPCTRGGGRVVAFARAKYPPDVRKSPAMHRELRRAGCREVTGAVTREALEEAGLGRGALPVLVPWESPEELAVRLREAMAALS